MLLPGPDPARDPPRLRDGCVFVFGGDATDKGGCDLQVLQHLNALKAAHPDRVHLILGNRDINKMRFLQELSASRVAQGLEAHPGTYWVNHFRAKNGKPPDTPAAFGDPSPESDRATIAKWMLGNTMGCPDTFELRRSELLAAKRRAAGAATTTASTTPVTVSDNEVADDLLRSVLPNVGRGILRDSDGGGAEGEEDGEMLQYLRNGRLAVRLGDLLFVHGAVWDGAFLAIPRITDEFAPSSSSSSSSSSASLPPPPPSIPTVSTREGGGVLEVDRVAWKDARGNASLSGPVLDEWIAGVNAFAAKEVQAFRQVSQRGS